MTKSNISIWFTLFTVFVYPGILWAASDAFPGAEGAGRYAVGGRGGDVYHVTSLNDSGAGSLRYGLTSAVGPRTIVFDISGNIHLTSDLSIGSNITVAGQTAPGKGIAICDRQTTISGSNVVVRYMRFRPGDTYCPGYQPDALWVTGSENVIIDHVSASWSIDEVLSVTHGSNNVTVQWSIISEALHDSCHEKGNHGYGSLINGGDFSFHHNLYAHNRSRNPRPGGSTPGTRLDFVNNVIYDPGDRFGYGDGSEGSPLIMNIYGNYGISGPNTTSRDLYASNSTLGVYNHIFQGENKIDTNKNGILDGVNTGWNMFSGPENQYSVPFNIGDLRGYSADDAYFDVIVKAGASLVRDPVDVRVIDSVVNQTGDHIDSPAEVGGWPELPVLNGPTDTDRDGMPDIWEDVKGLDAAYALDRNGYDLSQEYTNLEVYLNSLIFDNDTVPSVPENLVAEKLDGKVLLCWDDNTDSVGGYYVYRSNIFGSDYVRISSLLHNSEYEDSAVEKDVTYYYVVTAIDDMANESGYSNEAVITIFDTIFYRDINKDNIVDISDLSAFVQLWLETDCYLTTSWDVDNDCIIKLPEFNLMSESWLTSSEPNDIEVTVSKFSNVSCRTSLNNGTTSEVDINKSESNKLSVRGDSKAAKSWIKFDLGGIDPSSIVAAQLRVTIYEPKASQCYLSAVNDDCLDNINWSETGITWNNAPGNYTSSDGVNPDLVGVTVNELQDNLDPDKTSLIGTLDYTYGALPGDQFYLDVLSVMQADTDGIIQFVLHGAGGYSNFTTHDSTLGEEYWPMLLITCKE